MHHASMKLVCPSSFDGMIFSMTDLPGVPYWPLCVRKGTYISTDAERRAGLSAVADGLS